jgi:hypothetical protein
VVSTGVGVGASDVSGAMMLDKMLPAVLVTLAVVAPVVALQI